MNEKNIMEYQCIKTSLKSVVKDDSVIAIIMEAALRANGIMIHTLQLLKLYNLIRYEDTKEPVYYISNSTGRPPSDGTKQIKVKLKDFYAFLIDLTSHN